MLEKGQNGMVWRPMFAPMPVKNLVVEPVAVWITAGTGTVIEDVMQFDSMALTVDVVMKNTASRALEGLVGMVEVYIGPVQLGTFIHKGDMAIGASMSHSISGVIKEVGSQASKALFAAINAQDPVNDPIVSVMVTGDFQMPMRGPMGRLTVANQAVSIKNLPISRRSGSPVRTFAEV